MKAIDGQVLKSHHSLRESVEMVGIYGGRECVSYESENSVRENIEIKEEREAHNSLENRFSSA